MQSKSGSIAVVAQAVFLCAFFPIWFYLYRMDELTDKQKIAYARIKQSLRSARHIGELDEDLLKMAACLTVEVRELQAIIDEKGYTYEFKNRDGGVMTKHRPEHQMLVESRSKYLVVLKELGMTPAARKRIEVDVELDDELEELLTFKDASI